MIDESVGPLGPVARGAVHAQVAGDEMHVEPRDRLVIAARGSGGHAMRRVETQNTRAHPVERLRRRMVMDVPQRHGEMGAMCPRGTREGRVLEPSDQIRDFRRIGPGPVCHGRRGGRGHASAGRRRSSARTGRAARTRPGRAASWIQSTDPRIRAIAAIMRAVIGSRSTNQPSSTATTGFTYAYVPTMVAGAWSSA